MVVDASVWVGYFVTDDVHHEVSRRWLRSQFADHDQQLHGPSLLLAEVAGAVSRRTQAKWLAQMIVREMLELPELELIRVDERLGLTAARLAGDLRLRGADACYVAVAHELGLPLVTWDDELYVRAAEAVSVLHPERLAPATPEDQLRSLT